MKKVLTSLLASLALTLTSSVMAAPTDESIGNFKDIIDTALNQQSVVISAPGFPSQVHEMTMVAEDPTAQKNLTKKYHDAEKIGWSQIIAYGRLLEAQGLMTFEQGTFDEISFWNEKFTFTGFLMHFTDKAKESIVVMPKFGRVGLKIGVVGVDKLLKYTEPVTKDGKTTTTVSFTSKIVDLKDWVTPEILKSSGIESFLGGTETVNLTLTKDAWVIDDAEFSAKLKLPLLDFE